MTFLFRAISIRKLFLSSPSHLAQSFILGVALVAGRLGVVRAQQPSAAISPEAQAASGTYVGRIGDYVELRPDGSFVLRFRGQTARGSFTIQGQEISLKTPNDPRPAKARLIESALIFPSGDTYTKRNEPSGLNQPGQVQAPSPATGPDRYLGIWKSVNSGDRICILKEGQRFKLIDHGDVFILDLKDGSLHSGTLIGNVDYLDSSGHIVWRGMELAQDPAGTALLSKAGGHDKIPLRLILLCLINRTSDRNQERPNPALQLTKP